MKYRLLWSLAILSFLASSMSSKSRVGAAAPASDTTRSSDSKSAILGDVTTTAAETEQLPLQLDEETIKAYEALDKWKECSRKDAPVRLVYKHNRSRAAATGFPTCLKTGTDLGLTEHETAAIFGWTTGDYRLVNPIARGLPRVEFDDYPFLPQELVKVKCHLNREDVMPYVRVLQSALSKLPKLNSQQRLWRGHRRKLESSKAGSIIRMDGFSSFTRDRENAIEFAAKSNEGRSNHRTVIAVLDHSSGKCVSKLSARPGEMEVLFPLNTAFEVVDPPGETGQDDLKAVQSKAEQMRESIPGGEIDLVYVREVGPSDGRNRNAADGSVPIRIIPGEDL